MTQEQGAVMVAPIVLAPHIPARLAIGFALTLGVVLFAGRLA